MNYVKLTLISFVVFTCLALAGDAAFNAQYVSDAIPTTMNQSQAYTVSITMHNNGNMPWNSTASIKLGDDGLHSDTILFSSNNSNRIYIPAGLNILPNSDYTFNFVMTAPAPGTYSVQYQMLREGVSWFGAAVPKIIIVVYAATPIWNTYTIGDTINTVVPYAGAGYTNVTYHFVVNGVDYPQTTPSYSFVMTKVDFYNITTYASTDQGIVNTQLYEAQGLKKLATNHTIDVDHSGMDNLTGDVNNFDDVRLLQDANLPFTNLLGNWYWLVIFSLPFLFIWINSGTLKIPGVLFLMLGWLVIGMVPSGSVFIVYIGFGCVLGSSFYSIIERH